MNPLTADDRARMYAEIVRGVAKEQSRYSDRSDFDEAWETTSAEVAASNLPEGETWEIPNELPDLGDGDDDFDPSSMQPVPLEGAEEQAAVEAEMEQGIDKADAIVAAGPPSLDDYRPPASWFSDPGLDGPTPLTVTEDGRVYGHLATWGTCHTSHTQECVTAPRSETGYAYFHTGAVLTKDGGEVAVGHLTMNTGHADTRLRATDTMAHYDNTGTVAADVRAGDDEHGIWVSGALRPGLSAEQRHAFRAAPLSGDWRRIQGNLELVAALSVNVPGFPIPRGFVAAGMQQSLTASAGVLYNPVEEVDEEETALGLSAEDLAEFRAILTRSRQTRTLTASALARRVKASDLWMRRNREV